MPVTNSIPDADRYSRYQPLVPTTNFPVNFVLFTGDADEAREEIEVRIDGQTLDTADYSLSGTFDFTTDYPVNTDAEVVLPAAVSGVVVEIEGCKVIERVAQLPNGQGVPPSIWNIILNRIWAILRELSQRLNRVPMMPYGEEPPTPAEMLAWRDQIQNPGTVFSVNGRGGAVILDKSDVGLANVPNYPVASQGEAEAGGVSDKLMTPQRVAQAIAALAPGVRLPAGYLFGLTLSNNASDASNDIDVAVGKARDSTDAADLVLTSVLRKRTDAAWVAGNNQGGMMGGLTRAANTWYAVHLIRNPDTGVVDVGFHTSPTAPTLPIGYTQFRRIGWIRTDGSGAVRAFIQRGDWFDWVSNVIDNAIPAAGLTTRQLLAPPSTEARFHAEMTPDQEGVVSRVGFLPTDAGSTGLAGLAARDPGFTIAAAGHFNVSLNESSQLRIWRSNEISNFTLSVLSWCDTRGRLA